MDKQHCSQLFLVRIWREKLANGRMEWRGQVKHVLSGEVSYFRDLHTLVKLLNDILKAVNPLWSQEE